MPDLIDGVPHPVVVLPGITATTLADRYPLRPETIWDPVPPATKDYRRTMPHPENPLFEMFQPAMTGPERFAAIVYDEFVSELRANLGPDATTPAPVYPFVYDWRLPLDVVAKQLFQFCQDVVKRARLSGLYPRSRRREVRVNLVGHSMGGLIMAGAVAEYGSRLPLNKAVSIGTPFLGSMEALERMTLGRKGDSAERFGARLTPSLYYLLPRFAGALGYSAEFLQARPAHQGRPVDLTDMSIWQPSILRMIEKAYRDPPVGFRGNASTAAQRFVRDLVTSSKAFMGRINQADLLTGNGFAHDQWLVITGIGDPTRQSAQVGYRDNDPFFEFIDRAGDDDWWDNGTMTTEATGDGTVPFRSAAWGAVPRERVVCYALEDFRFFGEMRDRTLSWIDDLHAFLPTMDMIQRVVISYFKGDANPYGKLRGRVPIGADPAAWGAATGLGRR